MATRSSFLKRLISCDQSNNKINCDWIKFFFMIDYGKTVKPSSWNYEFLQRLRIYRNGLGIWKAVLTPTLIESGTKNMLATAVRWCYLLTVTMKMGKKKMEKRKVGPKSFK